MFHAGIDLHKKYSYIVVLNDQGDVVSQDRVENDNILAYLEAFSEPLQVTFEATYNWQQLYDVLDGHVARLVLAHPKQVKAIAAAKVKTDRIDARVLADLLRVNLLPIAYAAPQPIRDLRDLMRHRVQLVRQRTQIKNRIHAVLARYPLSRVPGGLFSKRGRAYLQTVTLRPSHRTILDDDLWVLDQLNQRIHERDKQIARLARSQPEAHLLTTIPGVGPFSALMIIAELGDIGRFTTPKQVASYAGVVPGVHSSGGHTRHGSITKEGSPWLRWVMVEAAQSASRYSPSLGRFHARLAFKHGRNAAKVAVARKMLTIIFWMLTRHEPYQEPTAVTAA